MIRKLVVAVMCVSFLAPIGAMFAPINRTAATGKPVVTAVAPATNSSTSSPAPITTRTS